MFSLNLKAELKRLEHIPVQEVALQTLMSVIRTLANAPKGEQQEYVNYVKPTLLL